MNATATKSRPKVKAAPKPVAGRLTMPANDLKRLVKIVAAAASTDAHRPILCGVLFDLVDNRLTLVATDSYRLYHLDVNAGDDQAPFKAIIPASWLTRWTRTPFHRLDEATLAVADGRCSITVADEQTSTSLIATANKYPNWQKLYETAPGGQPEGVTAGYNPKDLAGVFRAAHLFGGDFHPVRLTGFDPLKPSRWTVQRPGESLDMLLMPVRLA